MDFLNSITNCFGSTVRDNDAPDDHEKPRRDPNPVRSVQEISKDVIELLRVAEKNGSTLRLRIDDVVGDQGWTESIARAIVAGLEALIKQGRDKIGPVLGEFIDKAENAAKAVFAFPHAHPYLTAGFATIVAVGVLVLVAPWAVEALGFAEMGPVADSFAAGWQSTYAGFVPKNSLFSFFQRLGMIWERF
ncbi:hypothetical protein PspLS_07004 [Pyricularia sp. CBS 133598]|nr:hypothetical protein PspLS_07004 [Pyricularia sp. CBS 133598]